MAFKRKEWKDGEAGNTPVTADELNRMEQGIEDAGKTGGVEVGTIVHIEDDAPVPEGYVEVKSGYSTNEVKTGEYWIDGKPIYRKVIHFVTSSELIGIPIGISNLERIVDFRGCADWFPINFTTFDNGTPYFVATQYRIEQGQIIHICSSDYANRQAYAIIEYTKTTD
jgi:hypothetical protein